MPMAVAFSNPSLSCAPPGLSPLPAPSRALKPLISTRTLLQRRLICRCEASVRFPGASSSSSFLGRVFRSTPETAESHSKTINGADDDEISKHKTRDEVETKYPRTLKALIQVYKEAVLVGNEKTISDIEAMISTMENEKISLLQKISEISSDIVSGKDKFLRLKADFDNFRKRTEKDRLTLTSDVRGEVIESLLPMVDSFEKAKQQMKPKTEREKKIDTSYQGIYKQFVEILRSLQVAVVQTVGKPFDPSLHEAIAREESKEFDEGIIIEEVRRGFVLGDKLLRPAMVKVSSGRKKATKVSGRKKAVPIAEQSIQQPAGAAETDEGSLPSR